jgi:hypothetical protein
MLCSKNANCFARLTSSMPMGISIGRTVELNKVSFHKRIKLGMLGRFLGGTAKVSLYCTIYMNLTLNQSLHDDIPHNSVKMPASNKPPYSSSDYAAASCTVHSFLIFNSFKRLPYEASAFPLVSTCHVSIFQFSLHQEKTTKRTSTSFPSFPNAR